MTEDDVRYKAVQSRDARFDGYFFVAVTSTGIYCRPSCASVVPRRSNVCFYKTAAAAQRGGFRACKRCRPDASLGSPEWASRSDVAARAMQAIADGVVDREGVSGLAGRLGYSTRQLNRLLIGELGAGPVDLARAQRAQTARTLLETTSMPAGDVAFAAGFGSVRQFNDTINTVFGEPPTALRARSVRNRSQGARSLQGRSLRARPQPAPAPAGSWASITLRLAYRPPLASAELFGFLATRGAAGVEEGSPSFYRRAVALPHGPGLATVACPAPGQNYLVATICLADLQDLSAAVRRLRQLFDLDADPAAISAILSRSALLAPAVAKLAGLRSPGHVDGDEMALRAVLGQQVSVAGARTLAARLAAAYGQLMERSEGTVVTTFPTAAVLAGLAPQALPMPASRAACFIRLAEALASGEVDLRPGSDRELSSARLAELPGIGPWTVAYIRMRALGDPDAFLAGDLGLRRALERAGLAANPKAAAALAETWRPYRAYALHYLWSGAISVPLQATKESVVA